MKTCPKCGDNGKHWRDRSDFDCGSVRYNSGRRVGEFHQSPGCRTRQLEAVVLKIDRMASAWLSHGRDEVKPFAREVFDACEQIVNPPTVDDTCRSKDSATAKTGEITGY